MISPQQTPEEWLWFLDQLPVLGSVLEIGSFDGNSLVAWATSGRLAVNAVIRSVDFNDHGTGRQLELICDQLSATSYDVKCRLGNSRDPDTIAWARERAPYDMVFIDGDHSYEGVRADWETYGPMGHIVAFHDVLGHQPGCVKLWQELRRAHNTAEYLAHERYRIVSQSAQGIGVIFLSEVPDRGMQTTLRLDHSAPEDGHYVRGTWVKR